jgi:hypothetical protein
MENLPPKEKKVVDKIEKVKRDFELLRNRIIVEGTIMKHVKKGAASNIARRKKKFRKVGGKKGWKPL